MRILICESEQKIARILYTGLKAERFAVDMAADACEALVFAGDFAYDLLIFGPTTFSGDIGFFKQLHATQPHAPALVLLRSNLDTIAWLKAGADTCALKPFSFEQLLTHIRALLRRRTDLHDTLRVGDLEIDRISRRVTRAGKPIALTAKEYGLLECLARNVGRPLSRTLLVEHVWNSHFDGLTNIVDVYVSLLRAKVDRGFEKRLIQTVRGIGYVLEHGENRESEQAASNLPAA